MYITRDRALADGNDQGLATELRDRVEILDALYRFGLGQDLHDRDLFRSAFAEDAELDFAPAAARWGATAPVMTGRATIVDSIMAMFAGRVDTTHVVTNPRIEIACDEARLTAVVEAQHLLTADHSRHALLKNLYDVVLVRDGDRWVMRHVRIENIWYTGEPTAIFSPEPADHPTPPAAGSPGARAVQ